MSEIVIYEGMTNIEQCKVILDGLYRQKKKDFPKSLYKYDQNVEEHINKIADNLMALCEIMNVKVKEVSL